MNMPQVIEPITMKMLAIFITLSVCGNPKPYPVVVIVWMEKKTAPMNSSGVSGLSPT